MRAGLKRAAEGLLVHSGLASAKRRGLRDRTLVLAYHNVVPDDQAAGGDQSLHLRRGAFVRQLDELTRHCDVVPLERSFDPPHPGSRPRVVITFDDAYRGAVMLGVSELAARGLPATLFVAPAYLGGRSFWWDTLAGSTGLTTEVRRRALETLRGREEDICRWAKEVGMPGSAVPAMAQAASVDEVLTATTHPGITVGSHSWSHPNLARLTGPEMADELVRSRDWLRTRFGTRFLPWIAYPYGSSSPDVERAAAAAGYDGGFRVDGGWLPRAARPGFSLPRFNVPAGLSEPGFALRTAGFFCR